MQKKIKAIIVGASGYTGAELVRLLCTHPHVEICALVAESNAGNNIEDLYPHFSHLGLPTLVKLDTVDFSEIDVAFCCLPHATSQQIIASLPSAVKVIDLSADFRIKDPILYEEWYGVKHEELELQKQAVYGLTEHYGSEIAGARLVACPGCYPTSMLLPLLPLMQAEIIKPDGVIIDSKSGISGAGRSAKTANLFTEVSESVRAYGVGGHRHVAEVEQELSAVVGRDVMVTFTPQVVPMKRGILSTIYVDLVEGKAADDVYAALNDCYKNAPFVTVHNGYAPQTAEVSGTNYARIGVFADRIEGRCIIVSAIDNLIKGSSGQAVQNMNLMFDLPQEIGLNHIALVP